MFFFTVASAAPRIVPGQSSRRFNLAKIKQMKLEIYSDERQIQPVSGELDSWALPEILIH